MRKASPFRAGGYDEDGRDGHRTRSGQTIGELDGTERISQAGAAAIEAALPTSVELAAELQGMPPGPLPAAQAGGFHRVLSNAGANMARQVSALLVVLVLPPLLVRSLDKSTYALWLLILQITSYITLLDNGIQTVVTRYVALERAITGQSGVARVVSNATVLLGIVAALMLLIFVAGSPALAWLLPRQPSGLLLPAEHALMITATAAALALPFSSLAGMFIGDQRAGVNALGSTIGKLVGSAAVAWVALRHRGLEAMAVALASGTVLQSMFYVAAARFRRSGELFAWRLVSRSYLGELFTFSVGMLVSQFAGLLIAGLDLPMVSAFDFPRAAYYGLALTTSNLLLVPSAALMGAFLPVITAIHAQRDANRLGRVLSRIMLYSNVFLGVLTLFLGVSLPALLHWWVRPDYAEHTLPLAEILIVAQAIRLSCSPYSIAGFSAGRQMQMLYSPMGEGIVNVIFSYFGARWMGAMGVAWGTLLGAVVGVLLHMMVSVPRTQDEIRVNRSVFVMRGLLRPLVTTLAALPVYVVGRRWATTPARLLGLAVACSLAAAAVAWWWALGPADRERISAYARKLRPSRQPQSPLSI